MVKHSFGTLHLDKLLNVSNLIEVVLIDSAEKRPLKKEYSYETINDKIKIFPQENREKTLIMNKTIQLTPELISYIGLYLGDGNKTGNIGFSQREINILKFSYDMEKELFRQNFIDRWSILEDTRRFEDVLIEPDLEQIKKEFSDAQTSLVGEELTLAIHREFLIRDFLTKAKKIDLHVNRNNIGRPTISPLKGARSAGKSSLEYIHVLMGSSPFLPLWLKIVYDVTNIILNNGNNSEWITFNMPPSKSKYHLQIKNYVSKLSYKTSKKTKTYAINKDRTNHEVIKIYKTRRTVITLCDKLVITPFLFIISGLYLAEGDTKKENMFLFNQIKVPLKVGMTSSENRIITAFIDFLNLLGPELISKWKVKVGAKYYFETEELAQKLGVVTLRGGEKGQGYVRTQELHEAAKYWAIKEFPIFKDSTNAFSNLEITGVGIPRVHVLAKSTLDVFFISLVRDAVFYPETLFAQAQEVIF